MNIWKHNSETNGCFTSNVGKITTQLVWITNAWARAIGPSRESRVVSLALQSWIPTPTLTWTSSFPIILRFVIIRHTPMQKVGSGWTLNFTQCWGAHAWPVKSSFSSNGYLAACLFATHRFGWFSLSSEILGDVRAVPLPHICRLVRLPKRAAQINGLGERMQI